MIGAFRIARIKTHLVIWFLLVSVIPLLAAFAVVTYRERIDEIKREEYSKLIAVRDMKIEQLNDWLDEKTVTIQNIARIRQIREQLEKLRDCRPGPDRERADVGTIRKRLDEYVDNGAGLQEIFILNPDSGKVVASTAREREGEDRSSEPYYRELRETEGVAIHDIEFSGAEPRAVMSFSTPIRSACRDEERVIGILVAQIDLKSTLYKILLNRAGMGETGETYILNRNGQVVSELRGGHGANPKVPVAAPEAAIASRGATGIVEAADYRDEPVLAAYAYISKTGWGFVAKQDQKEIFAQIERMVYRTGVLSGLMLAAVLLIGYFMDRSIAAPIRAMARVARSIEAGAFSGRIAVERSDELGDLETAFNSMAESVQNRMSILQCLAELDKALAGAGNLEEFYRAVTKELIGFTGSCLGAAFEYDADGGKFAAVSAMGVDPALLEPFSAQCREGEFGKVLATERMSLVTDIPEETRFTFQTMVGSAWPKAIVTMPVKVRDRVRLVVSLASLSGYSEHHMKFLELAWGGVGTALSNLMAFEEREMLTRQLQTKNVELEARAGELLAQKQELKQQSDELLRQNAELDIQKRRVEEASKLKSAFLSNMSHELRTPLNSVMALAKVLIIQGQGKLSEEELGYLEIIERNGQKLLFLINDILDLSKIEAGKVDLNVSEFSPAVLIGEVVERLRALAEAKGLGLFQEVPDDLPTVESDDARVDQILQNLIGNSVKFTEKGSVTVSAAAEGGLLHFQVKDTGIGIPEDELLHIFEEFRQVDGSASKRYEGAGLGLAIAARVARLLKGDLTVSSSVGEGSAFTLTIPVRWTERKGQ